MRDGSTTNANDCTTPSGWRPGTPKQPLLEHLAPITHGPIGSSLSYLVDVTGTGFVPASVIQAGGVAQTTTYVSATELTATETLYPGTELRIVYSVKGY